jgi:hypothetical protein
MEGENLRSNFWSDLYFKIRCLDSAVGIATGYGLEDRWFGVRVPVGQEFSLLHIVYTGTGVHPASYTMGTGASFFGGEVAGAWSWPLISN